MIIRSNWVSVLFMIHVMLLQMVYATPPACFLSCINQLSQNCQLGQLDLTCLCDLQVMVLQCGISNCRYGNYYAFRDHFLGTCLFFGRSTLANPINNPIDKINHSTRRSSTQPTFNKNPTLPSGITSTLPPKFVAKIEKDSEMKIGNDLDSDHDDKYTNTKLLYDIISFHITKLGTTISPKPPFRQTADPVSSTIGINNSISQSQIPSPTSTPTPIPTPVPTPSESSPLPTFRKHHNLPKVIKSVVKSNIMKNKDKIVPKLTDAPKIMSTLRVIKPRFRGTKLGSEMREY